MKLAHIVPTSYLDKFDLITNSDFHMVLAHQVLKDELYASFFFEQSKKSKYVLLGNSAFEFGDAIDDLILTKAIEKINPTEFILPDVLFDSESTYKRTINFLNKF